MAWNSYRRFLMVVMALFALPVGARMTGAQEEGQPATAPAATSAETKEQAKTEGGDPVVLMKTSMGDVKIKLFKEKAPISVANFLAYVDEKFYDGTIFHRVIQNFMIQGGGFNEDLTKKETKAPIKNEAENGLSNKRGTLAMARTNVVDSATSQFFINVVDNKFLDHNGPNFGYAVFGEVISGMDVVDKIRAVKTGAKPPFASDCPLTPVTIVSVKRVES